MRVVAVCLMLTAGLTTTSCDEDTLQTLLGGLFNPGETYNYVGTVKASVLGGKGAEGYTKYLVQDAAVENKSVTFKAQQASASVVGQVVLPALSGTNGDTQFSILQATISDIVCTTTNGVTRLALPTTGFGGEGTITVNGTPYNMSNAYIDPSSSVTQSDIHLVLSIYYGENEEYAVNFEYTGKN